MSRLHHWLLCTATGLLAMLPATALQALQAPPKTPRVFLGTFDVAPSQRQELIATLKEKGFAGAYIPENASPDTLFYRGTRAEYDAAMLFYWDVQSKKAKKPTPRPTPTTTTISSIVKQQRTGGAPADKDVLAKLSMSALQKDLTDELLKECDKRLEEFHNKGATEELKAKGLEFNKWKLSTLKAILTRDQFEKYYLAYGTKPTEEQLGGKPNLPKIDPKAEKTDEAILEQLQLSSKQKEAFDKLNKWMKEATIEMKKPGKDHIAEGQQLNIKWRAGLDRIFTKDQRKQYMDYWGPPPKFAGE
ncbi:MAG: hypothetical protein QM703_18550 [Gemmatales bacterium]